MRNSKLVHMQLHGHYARGDRKNWIFAMLPENPTAFDTQEFLKEAMERTGWDMTNLAKRAGVMPSTITRAMRNNVALRRATVALIAKAAGMPEPLPTAGTGSHRESRPHPSRALTTLPIRALIGSPVKELYYLNHTPMDSIARPSRLASASRAFAVRMPDETMEGWRRPNELVILDPMRAIGEGDHALVEFGNVADPNSPGLFAIRRVARRRQKEITLGRWGFDPREETFAPTEIVSLTRVIEWPELLGD